MKPDALQNLPLFLSSGILAGEFWAMMEGAPVAMNGERETPSVAVLYLWGETIREKKGEKLSDLLFHLAYHCSARTNNAWLVALQI